MSRIAVLESLGISEALLKEKEAPFIAKGHTFVHYEKTGDQAALKKRKFMSPMPAAMPRKAWRNWPWQEHCPLPVIPIKPKKEPETARIKKD